MILSSCSTNCLRADHLIPICKVFNICLGLDGCLSQGKLFSGGLQSSIIRASRFPFAIDGLPRCGMWLTALRFDINRAAICAQPRCHSILIKKTTKRLAVSDKIANFTEKIADYDIRSM